MLIRICLTLTAVLVLNFCVLAQKRIIRDEYLKITPYVSTLEDVNRIYGRQTWKPATYMGLTMGTSTRDDMVRVFGKSDDFDEIEKWRSEVGDPSAEILYVYENVGEIRGLHRIAVREKDSKIMWILVEPDKMQKSDIVRLYGSNYRIQRYGFDDCIDDADGVPIFESPNGELEQFEYRELGVFFRLGKPERSENRAELVDMVMFVSEPPGSTESMCKGRSEDTSGYENGLKENVG